MNEKIFSALVCFLIVTSCANSSLKPDTFDRDSVQRISNVLYGEVVSLKKVSIEGSTTPGTIVGGLVGAAAGSEISNSKPESEIGAVLGGAIGATLGGNLSKSIQTSRWKWSFLRMADLTISRTLKLRASIMLWLMNSLVTLAHSAKRAERNSMHSSVTRKLSGSSFQTSTILQIGFYLEVELKKWFPGFEVVKMGKAKIADYGLTNGVPTPSTRVLPNSAMLGLERWYHASLFVQG